MAKVLFIPFQRLLFHFQDRDTAEKVRRKLEAKSRLYDRVNSGKADLDDYLQENCLVDFDGKPVPKESRGRDRTRERHTSHQVTQFDIKFYPFENV